MGAMAIGRQVQKNADGFELREPESPYNAVFSAKKNDIGRNNLWFWKENGFLSSG
jgi:hypothetical protein